MKPVDITFLAKDWLEKNLCSFNEEPVRNWLQYYINENYAENYEQVGDVLFTEYGRNYMRTDMQQYIEDNADYVVWEEVGKWLMEEYDLKFYEEED